MRLLLLSSFLFLLTFTGSVQAEIQKYEFEKPHTQIGFFVSHLGLSNSYGRFLDFDGTIEFDRDEPQNSKAEITIKTDSIQMASQKWNDSMKNENWLNVVKYPEMTFKSKDINITGDKTALIVGELTIQDVTRIVTLDTIFNDEKINPFSQKYTTGFSARTKIKRSEFGMTYGLPAVGDELDLRIEVEAYCVENCPETVNP